ncbi:MAG: AAA family ATPase, partial [Candidatus Eisenbacteria bacterium]|nr:AAA family ATPase [Candidatus Eisenbacteria bacterium]
EGKSTTVAYLASALALHPERRILAADFDFRDPQLNAHFEVPVERTLGDAIGGECRLHDAILKTELPNLDLALPCPQGEDPGLLLRTRECSLTIEYFREQYDLVLLDVPALLPVADASVLLPFVDGVILVTMAGRTTKPALRRAREICLGMGVRILGLVVGNLKEAMPEYGGGRYYEYYKRKKEKGEGSSEGDAGGDRKMRFRPEGAAGQAGEASWGPKQGGRGKRGKKPIAVTRNLDRPAGSQ